MNLQIEVIDDKKVLNTMDERNAELRSKILDIIRDRTLEEVEGTEGKQLLEKEILRCVQGLFDKDKVFNVFIDDIVVQ